MFLKNDNIYNFSDYLSIIYQEVDYTLSIVDLDKIKNIIFGGDINYAKAIALKANKLNLGFYACILDDSNKDDINYLINLGANIIKTPAIFKMLEAEEMANDLLSDISDAYLYKIDNKYASDFYFNVLGSKIMAEINDLKFFLVTNKNKNLLNGLSRFFLRKTDVKIIALNFEFDLADEVLFDDLDNALNKYNALGKTLIV